MPEINDEVQKGQLTLYLASGGVADWAEAKDTSRARRHGSGDDALTVGPDPAAGPTARSA
jgi:hypothetical protein